jgi:hypothetical protein
LAAPNGKKRLTQLVRECYCREILIAKVRGFHSGVKGDVYGDNYMIHKMDVRKTRLMFAHAIGRSSELGERAKEKVEKKTEEWAKNSEALIGTFEKEMGIKSSTKVFKVSLTAPSADPGGFGPHGRGAKRFVTCAPPIWQRSPFTLSLFALLIRMARSQKIAKSKTVEEFVKNAVLRSDSDGRRVREVAEVLETIVRNCPKLFRGKPKIYFSKATNCDGMTHVAQLAKFRERVEKLRASGRGKKSG